MATHEPIDSERAVAHLMDLLAVEGPSGREGRVAALVRKKLRAAGCRPAWMRHDDVHRRVPLDFEIGNLIVKLPGTVRGARRLFVGHMDTVPLCRGAVPVRRGRRIVSRGETGLGADNRTAVACLVTLIETLLKRKLPHPPLTVLFTVGEEVGLWGARLVSLTALGRPRLGFNVDSGVPADLVVGALGAERWEARIKGRSAHAGVHPDHGVSAALIASRAIADVADRGFFGKIHHRGKRGTSNVGSIRGGEANNQVADSVIVSGESRSHDPKFVTGITETYRRAFDRAARSVKNHRGQTGAVDFRARTDYSPFKLGARAAVVRHAAAAARSTGFRPRLISVDGGADASWLNARGVPTVTLGAGQHGAHTVDEYVDVAEYVGGCRLALAIATADPV